MTVRFKICCIQNVEEAELAIRIGASALGFVSEMPSGPGVIDERLIATIVRTVPPGVSTFLLTSKQDADSIIAQHRICRTNTIQLCDRLLPDVYMDLRAALFGISLVQVVHVTGPESVEEALAIAPFVNALLLDSGNQRLAVKELGGTGRIHDWDMSRQIRECVNVPVFLAGGLTPDNVRAAVQRVNPFGVDVCSGVRTNGCLDEQKLQSFVRQIAGV
jgi:phosphoribosylanthranilate isomerase